MTIIHVETRAARDPQHSHGPVARSYTLGRFSTNCPQPPLAEAFFAEVIDGVLADLRLGDYEQMRQRWQHAHTTKENTCG